MCLFVLFSEFSIFNLHTTKYSYKLSTVDIVSKLIFNNCFVHREKSKLISETLKLLISECSKIYTVKRNLRNISNECILRIYNINRISVMIIGVN